ncbi:Stk1 family PASTA domain-containing Ser/Thr kinase [Cohnella fermenti]|uniref:Serine/threonine-protein kinase PrkC n=1 Tax=Cohnella fermenti TaxID=2565925 RepID=A0A4S4BH48_9BACL|nr:Stk1 family PASTA domain-containing Ser/Thr kinase [Cohnella fermenti]THF73239.1 Stk1 family PASTA domain-containing Ser/Thr kinase [Cohnella fermenti]
MIGHTLGGRYELLDRVGGGGMALVYKARDNLLNRLVAVKVLRQQFMHDEDFVRRFRREAQSAAALSHPNIVSIYDVGQEQDTHYIIMEFVDGYNLNEIIRDRAPLQVEEAVRIAAQISDALDHAHHNQIIHRDIKPHNILIGKNGRVKVTDFGIARAVTTSTITQTGSVLGSVHYFSPEHAKGVSTGEKSDIYSLGIVLYQMLTGRLPFLGESPISVALKHLQEPFERPKLVNPHIPQSVENIILKAMRKNPQERYPSAKMMLQDLETCLQPQRLHEPPIQFPSDSLEDDGEQTLVMPALKPDMRMSAEETIAKNGQGGDDEEEEPKRRWVAPTVFAVIAAILIAVLIWAVFALKGSFVPKDVDVPTVVEMSFEDAQAKLAEFGLVAAMPYPEEANDTIPAGYVIRQDKQDMKVKEGATITLTVSTGPELSTMPSLTDKDIKDAIAELKALGVTEDRIKQNSIHDESDAGTVLEQDPASGDSFDPEKDTITLTVSEGLEEFAMPELIGLTLEEVKAKLLQYDLKLPDGNINYEKSYSTKGHVFKQFPAEKNELVTAGTEVQIWIASGFPDDAKQRPFELTVYPTIDGQTSSVRILISDALGEGREWGVKKVQSPSTYTLTLVLAPGTSGKVTVYRDNDFFDEYIVPYEDDIPASAEPPAEESSEPEDSGGTDTGTTGEGGTESGGDPATDNSQG